jgi:PHP family Zn ribbon phosphoesterase
MDLHLHTPASSDYQTPEISYLDILRRAEARGLDIISFADHNTVAGHRKLREEIEQLELLQKLNRILPEEELHLKEYQRLLDKILLLPGFEFTATFGFHVMGIFSPQKPLRELEHILLELNVPSDQLDEGSVTVGASADVLAAYQAIHDAGGIAIAAHANSSNGVAMRGFAFGGQTKIAYTQDPHLLALEVTDLDKRGRYATASFFSGTKPEYPRRMHCIQGSDAHRLETDPRRSSNLGVGDRVTEVLLPELSFDALKELFESNDFARTRPRHKQRGEAAFDFVRGAREEGANLVQDFHESLNTRGGHLANVIADVCAFANTNGGTLFIGVSSDPGKDPVGVRSPGSAIKQLEDEISKRISPPIKCTVDSHQTSGKNVIRILVPRGEEPPYAVDDNKIYLRNETETDLAVRDEIVGLVARSQEATEPVALMDVGAEGETEQPAPKPKRKTRRKTPVATPVQTGGNAPRTGVEIVMAEQRSGETYYTVRDLRNGNVVKNVTEKSARKLWHYAIQQHADLPKDMKKAKVDWKGDIGLLREYTQYKQTRYDFVERSNGNYRFYYGVTEDGIHGNWQKFVKNGDS